MKRVQPIEQNGKPIFYIVPAELWERMIDLAEDAEDSLDAAAYAEAVANDNGVRYPAPVAYAIADGANTLRAWREHRGLTMQALADAAGMSKPYISQIERGKRTGTAATLAKLAAVLDVPLAALAGLEG